MTKKELTRQIFERSTYLCVGLDTDVQKIPAHLRREKDPVFAFNRQVIDATYAYTVAYKPNIAFYEAMGASGWDSLARTVEYIPDEIFTIADAKRGDIGNTSGLYAKAFFETMDFDAITVAPYMGADSVTPFLKYPGKWVILLVHTSNPGSEDFQNLTVGDKLLYEQVMEKAKAWCGAEQMMFVVGATQAEKFAAIRRLADDYFFLVPGVGAQGGSLDKVSQLGLTHQGGLLVNSSRSIIYASDGKDFAQQAGKEAKKMQQEMQRYLELYA